MNPRGSFAVFPLGVLIIVVWAFASSIVSAQAPTGDQRPLATERPDPAGTPTTVGIGLVVVDLLSISDSTQTFEVDLFVTMTWRDPRLAHPDQPNAAVRRIATSSIWTPDIELFNLREDRSLLPSEVDVDGAGNVLVRRRIIAELTSPLNLLRFPRDQQKLPVRLVSSRYGPEEVRVELDRARYAAIEPFSIAGWSATLGEPEVTTLELQAIGRSFVELRFHLLAARGYLYYLWTGAVPLILIMLMAWSASWIDPSLLAPQIGVTTASIFTLIAFRLSLSTLLPPVSYMTSADYWMLGATLLVFSTLGKAVVVGYLLKTDRAETAGTVAWWWRGVYLVAMLGLVSLALIA